MLSKGAFYLYTSLQTLLLINDVKNKVSLRSVFLGMSAIVNVFEIMKNMDLYGKHNNRPAGLYTRVGYAFRFGFIMAKLGLYNVA